MDVWTPSVNSPEHCLNDRETCFGSEMTFFYHKFWREFLSLELHRLRHRSGDVGALNSQAIDSIWFGGPIPRLGSGLSWAFSGVISVASSLSTWVVLAKLSAMSTVTHWINKGTPSSCPNCGRGALLPRPPGPTKAQCVARRCRLGWGLP